MALTWAQMTRRMDRNGIPKVKPAANGTVEPEELFFDATGWAWFGRSVIDGTAWLYEQNFDGEWVVLRQATESDNSKIDAARDAELSARMDAHR